MKYKVASIVLVLAMLLAGFTSSVEAGAYTTQFTTSVTYQNVGDGPATIQLVFFAEGNANGIPVTLPELAPLAGTSIYVGGISDIANGFKGSAVMSSDQPLVSTLVQIPKADSGVAVRPMSNGFTSGSEYALVPTVLKNVYDYTSIVSVQNVSFDSADYELVFVPVSGANIVIEKTNVPPHATLYFDLGTMSQIPAGFNGSLQVFSTKEVVASAMELGVNGVGAYAFEGASEFADVIYMPSALCKYQGVNTSSYAVQNTTDEDIEVTVKYSGGKETDPVTLAAGAKASFIACDVNDDGYIGSAIIEATGEVVAMGKIYGGGLSTAFLGFNDGAEEVALPYVRWTNSGWANGSRQRAYIAIQNIGDDLAAGDVVVKYYDKDGNLVGSHELGAMATGAKANSTAGEIGAAGAEFGYYAGGLYGGSAVVEGPAGSKLAVIVRIAQMAGSSMVAEDYNGIPLQ